MGTKKTKDYKPRRVSHQFLIRLVGAIFLSGFILSSILAAALKAWKEVGGAAILFSGFFLSWVFALDRLKKKNPDLVHTLFIDPTQEEQLEEEKMLGISEHRFPDLNIAPKISDILRLRLPRPVGPLPLGLQQLSASPVHSPS